MDECDKIPMKIKLYVVLSQSNATLFSDIFSTLVLGHEMRGPAYEFGDHW